MKKSDAVKDGLARAARLVLLARRAHAADDAVSVCGLVSHVSNLMRTLLRLSTRAVELKLRKA